MTANQCREVRNALTSLRAIKMAFQTESAALQITRAIDALERAQQEQDEINNAAIDTELPATDDDDNPANWTRRTLAEAMKR